MLVGLLMIVAPGAVFLLTLPLSQRLKPGLGKLYRIVGGLVVFLGGGTSLYFASYTGDQGGIAAFLFQIVVILVYVVFSLSLVLVNWFLNARD
jgi:hypothetical protein